MSKQQTPQNQQKKRSPLSQASGGSKSKKLSEVRERWEAMQGGDKGGSGEVTFKGEIAHVLGNALHPHASPLACHHIWERVTLPQMSATIVQKHLHPFLTLPRSPVKQIKEQIQGKANHNAFWRFFGDHQGAVKMPVLARRKQEFRNTAA